MDIPQVIKDLTREDLGSIVELRRALNNLISVHGVKLYVKIPYGDNPNYMEVGGVESGKTKSTLWFVSTDSTYTLTLRSTEFKQICVKDVLGRYRSVVSSYQKEGKTVYELLFRTWHSSPNLPYIIVPQEEVLIYDLVVELKAEGGDVVVNLYPLIEKDDQGYQVVGHYKPAKNVSQVIQLIYQSKTLPFTQ